MRTCMLAAMIAGLLAPASNLVAGDACGCGVKAPTCQAAATSCGCNAGHTGDPACGNCDGCGNRCGCGLFGRKCGSGIDGLDRFASCGCNGSYNYPVPPLYTYHWPGMYKQVRMTDYHSPWRFPPLKKYEVEPLPSIEVPASKSAARPRLLRPVSLDSSAVAPGTAKANWHSEIEPLSSRLSR